METEKVNITVRVMCIYCAGTFLSIIELIISEKAFELTIKVNILFHSMRNIKLFLELLCHNIIRIISLHFDRILFAIRFGVRALL